MAEGQTITGLKDKWTKGQDGILLKFTNANVNEQK
jgi:hypothetical protein